MKTHAKTPQQEADAITHCEKCDSEDIAQEDSVYGITARYTVSCECGWAVEFDGTVAAPY